MKKQLLLILTMVALLACALTLTVCAEDVDPNAEYYDKVYTDANGKAVEEPVSGSDYTKHSYNIKSVKVENSRGIELPSTGGEGTMMLITIGSMVAQTAGIPLKTPTEDVNKYGSEGEPFLPGATTLTDILRKNGYYQALMVGSDVRFGGRKVYFEQHGMDEILDIYF